MCHRACFYCASHLFCFVLGKIVAARFLCIRRSPVHPPGPMHCLAPQGGHGEPRGVRSSSNWKICRLQQPFLIWGNTAPELQARSPTHGFKQTTNVPWQRLSMCNRGSRSPYLNLTKQPRCRRMCLRRTTSICCQVVRPTVSVELAVDVHDPSVHTPSATHVHYSPKVGPERGFGCGQSRS